MDRQIVVHMDRCIIGQVDGCTERQMAYAQRRDKQTDNRATNEQSQAVGATYEQMDRQKKK